MLEFIVLGKIPGTNLQITFLQVACLFLISMLVLMLLHDMIQRMKLPIIVQIELLKKLSKARRA